MIENMILKKLGLIPENPHDNKLSQEDLYKFVCANPDGYDLIMLNYHYMKRGYALENIQAALRLATDMGNLTYDWGTVKSFSWQVAPA